MVILNQLIYIEELSVSATNTLMSIPTQLEDQK